MFVSLALCKKVLRQYLSQDKICIKLSTMNEPQYTEMYLGHNMTSTGTLNFSLASINPKDEIRNSKL